MVLSLLTIVMRSMIGPEMGIALHRTIAVHNQCENIFTPFSTKIETKYGVGVFLNVFFYLVLVTFKDNNFTLKSHARFDEIKQKKNELYETFRQAAQTRGHVMPEPLWYSFNATHSTPYPAAITFSSHITTNQIKFLKIQSTASPPPFVI